MKKLMGVLLLLTTGILCADPGPTSSTQIIYNGNPDRYTSYGFDFTRTVEAGTLRQFPVTRSDGVVIQHYDFIGYSQTRLTFDLRKPVSNSFTVTVHGSPEWGDDQSGARLDGYSIGAGIRYYVH